MPAETVHVRGLKELQRDLRRANKDVAKEVRKELRDTGDVVREQAASLFGRYDRRTAAGFRVAVRARGVSVEQRLKRTSGLRPDYGALQMRRALIPALHDKADELETNLERMLDRLVGGLD